MSVLKPKFDIVVLGASGFTGKYVVRNLALMNKEADYTHLSWAVAGRSQEKLVNVLEELETEGLNVKNVPVMECDITNEAAIHEVCSQAKVLVNSTGPCTTLSEPLVRTCIKTRTHYVDISAELYHMLNIYKTYHKAAEEAEVLIITACGYGSLPGVMGFVHLENQFNGVLQRVECRTELEIPKTAYSFRNIVCGDNCLVNFGTWDSLVFELKNLPNYFRMHKEIFSNHIYGPEPEEMKRSFFHRKDGKIWFPYPGPDCNIIDMTQQYFHEKKNYKPVHFKMYTTMPLLIHMILIIPIFYCYYWLSYFKCFRALLRRYPRFFTAGFMTHQGPSEEIMSNTKYTFDFLGYGQKNNKGETINLKVSGSDPYQATAISFILSAITVLRDNSHMPNHCKFACASCASSAGIACWEPWANLKAGGVLTTGAAFHKTKIIDRLNCHGIHFEFVNDDLST